jgi:hypothetical protein
MGIEITFDTGATATGAGIGADGIGAGIAITLAAGLAAAGLAATAFAADFFVVVFFEVGILHSCFCAGPALHFASPCRSDGCNLHRETEREVSKIRRGSLRRKFFAESFGAQTRRHSSVSR